MRLLGLVIGVVVILGGAISFAAPDVLLALGRSVTTSGGLYAMAALRIALGLVFVLAAPGIAGTADAPRARRNRDHRGTDDALVRRRPRAHGPGVVGECRAVVHTPSRRRLATPLRPAAAGADAERRG